MILLLGDIHGNAGVLREAINKAEMVGDVTAIIQVGDFGLYPENEHYFKSVVEKSTIPIYFIEGNHDDCNLIQNMEGMKIDAFITHIPPHSVIEQHFDNTAKILFEVGPEWHDINQTIVEDLWNKMGNPTIYSGHMHKRVVGQNYRILDISELLAI